MTAAERNGRILLAVAVLCIFLSVTASMIAGRLLAPLVLGSVVIGVVGAALFLIGRRR